MNDVDTKPRVATDTPRYIRLNDADNVAIVANSFGLPAGTRFPCGLTLTERVPQGHKVALADIPADAPIVRYGEVIGYAIGAIAKGAWVEEAKVRMPAAPGLETLALATRVPGPIPPREG
jgi:galactarate dehydratase